MKRFVTVLATVALVIGWTARPAAGQFFVADALNEHDYEDFFEEFYDGVATELNSLFAMPERVGLTSAICGEPNAFFDPEGRQIIFCAELLELMVSSIDPSIDEPMQELMALAQVSFILTHEVGHALIRCPRPPCSRSGGGCSGSTGCPVDDQRADPCHVGRRLLAHHVRAWWATTNPYCLR